MVLFKICPIKKLFPKNDLSSSELEKGNQNCRRRMHLCRKLAYGMGGPPMQMLSNALGFFLPLFLLETAGISPYYLSAIQIIARIWDALTDPIFGYLVNRTNSPYGKFKPWMFFATPISCIAFFLQFYVPNFANSVSKFVFYCFTITLLQTGLTAFHVPYSSMCMVLTSNQEERDQLTSIRMAFEIIGVLFGAGVFGGISMRNRILNKVGHTNKTLSMIYLEKKGYMLGSVAVCIIFFICSISVLLGTKEREVLKDKEKSYLKNFKKIITFRPYLLVMLAFMFTSLGIQIIQSNLALYLTHTLEIPNHVTFGILVLLGGAFVLVPVGHVLLRRFGKKKIFFAGNINMIPMLFSLAFLPRNLNPIIFYAYMVWTSFSVMVAMVLPWSMLPDVIDLFLIKNGSRMESTFYSFYVFFNKFAVGISLWLSAIALGLANYDNTLLKQPESVSNMLRYFIGTSGIICLSISMIFLYFYPIDEKVREEISFKLDEMRDNLLANKIPIVLTLESELDIHCDHPSENEKRNFDLIEEKLIKDMESSYNVDFVL